MRFVNALVVSALLLMTTSCSWHRTPRPSDLGGHGFDHSVAELAPGISNTVYFDYNAYALSADYRTLVREQAQWLKKHKAHTIVIEGYCDERGTREYNLALGARRAESVKDLLIEIGIPAERITIISYGKDNPTPPRVMKGQEGYEHYLGTNRKATVVLR